MRTITTDEGMELKVLEIANASGTLRAEVLSYGATVTKLFVQGRNGGMKNILLGADEPEDYVRASIPAASIVGRFANRIGNGEYTVNGVTVHVDRNDRGNHLHGGAGNYMKKNWEILESASDSVHLRHVDDGAGGFPGIVTADVWYCLTEDSLEIRYEATASETTPINLTNHAYFNLSGEESGMPASHVITVNADFFTAVDGNCLPTGEICKVDGTPLDLRAGGSYGELLAAVEASPLTQDGFDHNFVINGRGYRKAAEVYDPESGRVMEVFTDLPGMQLYSANAFDGTRAYRGGVKYVKHHAYCFETQNFPNATSFGHFPNPFIGWGEKYATKTAYRFSVR